MTTRVLNTFPAGDESDDSIDEWDIGYLSKKKASERQASGVDGVVENDVSRLKQAISKADLQTVEQLLDQGIDVETRLAFDWTPLMCVVNQANHDMARLLLDRGASANFSKGHYTVLMAGCTASAGEDDIARCVELLLSRHADPNAVNRTGASSLMLAAGAGHCKVLNLLVSHGAQVNAQDASGYTALALASQHGRAQAALKLLQLGADKTLRTADGRSPADIAEACRHTQLIRILSTPGRPCAQLFPPEVEIPSRSLKDQTDVPDSTDCPTALGDLELLLHGLNLGYLADIMVENDITWSSLLTMERGDLEKVGITDPEVQGKVLRAVQDMVLDRVDMDDFKELNADSSSEEFHTFLVSLQQQCCYLTENIQEVCRRFPKRASEMVFSLDPSQEAEGVCRKLLLQTGDLQREVSCLYNLLSKTEQGDRPFRLPPPRSQTRGRGWLLTSVGLGALGALLVWGSWRALVPVPVW